jgi:hypothetical protein
MKESIDPMLISEWNGLSEQEIVSKVQDQVREALINHRFTVICGYNILRFDIPLLICRCVQYSLNKIDEIAKMWNDCLTIDYFQQLLVANRNFFKGLKADKIVEVSKKLGLSHHHTAPVEVPLKDSAKKASICKHIFTGKLVLKSPPRLLIVPKIFRHKSSPIFPNT